MRGHIDFFPSKTLSSLLAMLVTLIEQDLAIQSVAEHQKEDFWKYRLADLTPRLMNQSLHLNNILKQLKCTEHLKKHEPWIFQQQHFICILVVSLF